MAAPEGGLNVVGAQSGEFGRGKVLEPFGVLGEVAVGFGAEELRFHVVSQKSS